MGESAGRAYSPQSASTRDARSIASHVAGGAERIQRAIRSLERQELLRFEKDQVALTDDGRREARRLLRAHRLWETYLEHLGTPVDQLHDRAHELEHLHDEAAVDYLDDKLGHPILDPHGAVIPEDFVHLVPGAEVKAALLREGWKATVTEVAAAASDLPIAIGMRIGVGPRSEDQNLWTLILPDERELALDHVAMDAITVRLDDA